MRLAHYILALYTVLLSCIPCQDELPIAVAATHVVSASADMHDPHTVDLCSPFCICACCSGITLQPSIAALPEMPSFSFPDEKVFSYSRRIHSGDLTSIWQPPRI